MLASSREHTSRSLTHLPELRSIEVIEVTSGTKQGRQKEPQARRFGDHSRLGPETAVVGVSGTGELSRRQQTTDRSGKSSEPWD